MGVAVTGDGHVAMPYGKLPAPDVVDLLVQQHMEIRDGFGEVMAATGARRRDAFRSLVRLLAVHETAEEEVVHPALRGATAGGNQIVDDRLEEERAAKELLEQLDGMDVDDPAFTPLLLQLRAAVVSHAVSEQRYELNRIRQHLSAPRRAALRLLVQAAERTAPTHPHPGVESAKANLFLGPPVAIMDRARDAIRRARDSGSDTEGDTERDTDTKDA